jgi:hypothetical protein
MRTIERGIHFAEIKYSGIPFQMTSLRSELRSSSARNSPTGAADAYLA